MMEENKHGILLESGTNEIEVMKFTIGGNLFGIKVAKVLEIMISSPVRPCPIPTRRWRAFTGPGIP